MTSKTGPVEALSTPPHKELSGGATSPTTSKVHIFVMALGLGVLALGCITMAYYGLSHMNYFMRGVYLGSCGAIVLLLLLAIRCCKDEGVAVASPVSLAKREAAVSAVIDRKVASPRIDPRLSLLSPSPPGPPSPSPLRFAGTTPPMAAAASLPKDYDPPTPLQIMDAQHKGAARKDLFLSKPKFHLRVASGAVTEWIELDPRVKKIYIHHLDVTEYRKQFFYAAVKHSTLSEAEKKAIGHFPEELAQMIIDVVLDRSITELTITPYLTVILSIAHLMEPSQLVTFRKYLADNAADVYFDGKPLESLVTPPLSRR